MSVSMKFAQPIPEEIRITLQEMYMNHPTFRCPQRAQAILLSVRDDRPRSGCPRIYTEAEEEMLKTLVEEEPRQIKTAQTKPADMTQKVASTSTLKRLLKKIPLPLEADA
jgi:hypothetical protein